MAAQKMILVQIGSMGFQQARVTAEKDDVLVVTLMGKRKKTLAEAIANARGKTATTAVVDLEAALKEAAAPPKAEEKKADEKKVEKKADKAPAAK